MQIEMTIADITSDAAAKLAKDVSDYFKMGMCNPELYKTKDIIKAVAGLLYVTLRADSINASYVADAHASAKLKQAKQPPIPSNRILKKRARTLAIQFLR